MGYKILTNNGIDNTNIDGARAENFNAGMRDGIVKGALHEGTFGSNASNSIFLDTCELRLSGHRIIIDEAVYKTFTNAPATATRYSLIGQIVVDDNSNVEFSLFVQSANIGLTQDNLFKTINGTGTYQVEIGKFTLQTDGTVEDVVRTIDVITGGGNTEGGIDIGNITTERIDYKLDAEVDIDKRYEENEQKEYLDFKFSLPLDISEIITTEETNRNEADQALRNLITEETANRVSADNTLQANIEAEATARENADKAVTASLQAGLDEEISARDTADSKLQANIDAEALARQNADTTLQNNLDTAISSEASARTSADTTLQTNIDTEASTRAKADTTLQNNIDNEASARKAADTTLQNNIDAEATARANADTTLQTNINTEITNRTNADADLQSQIDNLDSVKANKTDVTAEINTAVSAVVDSAPEAFDTLKEIADWIAQDESGTEALVTRVSAIETKNTEQDTAISKAQSTADGAVSKNSEQDTRLTNIETKNTEQDTALANETTARKNADTTLQTNINTEASSRADADETLQSNIDAEASARQTADNTLTDSKLDNVTIASGSTNGTIKLTKTINGSSSSTDNIAVTGLKSAAYEESSAFATSAQGTLATNAVRSITSGTATTNGKVRLVVNTGGTSTNVDTAVTGLGSAAYTASTAYATAEQGSKADTALQSESDPTVPAWAKQATKPTYTADEVSGLATVATSGNYNDLSNLPIIPDGAVLYDSTGENTNGAMTQKATTDELATKPGLIVTASNGSIGEIFNDYTNNTANGNYSHSEGYGTKASGPYSHAEGVITTASGDESHAEGAMTTASGDESHAEGAMTKASGDYSHAEGVSAKASGYCSHAGGYYTTADQDSQTAIGKYNKIGQTGALFSVGNGTSDTDRNTAFEVFQDGHAELQGNLTANGTNINEQLALKPGLIVTDTSTGNIGEIFNDYTNNIATGEYSHAEGNYTKASGFISHAEGVSANASGTYSHAEGAVTTASGDYSHAEGYNSTASGNYSHAGGFYATADQDYQTAVGAGNLTGHTGALFSVGNGTMNGTLNRNTAFEVFQDGHAELQGDLTANGLSFGNSVIVQSGDNYVKFGSGLIIQWGSATSGSSSSGKLNYFPISFTSADSYFIVISATNGNAYAEPRTYRSNASSFYCYGKSMYNSSTYYEDPFDYIAIGV